MFCQVLAADLLGTSHNFVHRLIAQIVHLWFFASLKIMLHSTFGNPHINLGTQIMFMPYVSLFVSSLASTFE